LHVEFEFLVILDFLENTINYIYYYNLFKKKDSHFTMNLFKKIIIRVRT